MSDRLWSVLMAYQALVALLVEEVVALRNKTPEEGGWVRTENTAFRAASTPEAPPKVPEHETGRRTGSGAPGIAKSAQHRQALSEAGKSCSRCGKPGANVRTCLEIVPEPGPGVRTYYPHQRHRRPITRSGK